MNAARFVLTFVILSVIAGVAGCGSEDYPQGAVVIEEGNSRASRLEGGNYQRRLIFGSLSDIESRRAAAGESRRSRDDEDPGFYQLTRAAFDDPFVEVRELLGPPFVAYTAQEFQSLGATRFGGVVPLVTAWPTLPSNYPRVDTTTYTWTVPPVREATLSSLVQNDIRFNLAPSVRPSPGQTTFTLRHDSHIDSEGREARFVLSLDDEVLYDSSTSSERLLWNPQRPVLTDTETGPHELVIAVNGLEAFREQYVVRGLELTPSPPSSFPLNQPVNVNSSLQWSDGSEVLNPRWFAEMRDPASATAHQLPEGGGYEESTHIRFQWDPRTEQLSQRNESRPDLLTGTCALTCVTTATFRESGLDYRLEFGAVYQGREVEISEFLLDDGLGRLRGSFDSFNFQAPIATWNITISGEDPDAPPFSNPWAEGDG